MGGDLVSVFDCRTRLSEERPLRVYLKRGSKLVSYCYTTSRFAQMGAKAKEINDLILFLRSPTP